MIFPAIGVITLLVVFLIVLLVCALFAGRSYW